MKIDLENTIRENKVYVFISLFLIIMIILSGFYFFISKNVEEQLQEPTMSQEAMEKKLQQHFTQSFSNFFNYYKYNDFSITFKKNGYYDFNEALAFPSYITFCDIKKDCAYDRYDIHKILKKEYEYRKRMKQPLNYFKNNGLSRIAYSLSHDMVSEINNQLLDGMKIKKNNNKWNFHIDNKLTYYQYEKVQDKIDSVLCLTVVLNKEKIKELNNKKMKEKMYSIGDGWSKEKKIPQEKLEKFKIDLFNKNMVESCLSIGLNIKKEHEI